MKNTMRKAMLSTICMLIVAVMSLTGVTYAWFTAGTDATVDQINVSVVEASGGLQLSDDGDNWGATIHINDTFTFWPVSTAGNLDANNYLQFFKGTVDLTNYANVTSTAVTAEGYFFQKDIYVKNDTGAAVTVNLTGTTIVEGTGANNSHYASRVAFVVTDRSTSVELVKDGKGETSGETGAVATSTVYEVKSGEKFIYEPYATKHTERALAMYSTLTQDQTMKYYGIKSASSTPFAWNAAGTNTEDMEGKVKYSPAETTLTVPNGEYAKVTLYIWLEGSDLDCENSVSSDEVTFKINFAKVD